MQAEWLCVAEVRTTIGIEQPPSQSAFSLQPKLCNDVSRDLPVPHADDAIMRILPNSRFYQFSGAQPSLMARRCQRRIGREKAVQFLLEQDNAAAEAHQADIDDDRGANAKV